jgi:uncharacterized protein (DUF302 family)
MSYTFNKTLNLDFDATIEKVTKALAAEGFGVLTTIDVKATLKKKIDVDFRPYTILGACNPKLAHSAILAESNIGTMLPCNVVVQVSENGKTQVSAIDPVASMNAVENEALSAIIGDVREKLQRVIDGL